MYNTFLVFETITRARAQQPRARSGRVYVSVMLCIHDRDVRDERARCTRTHGCLHHDATNTLRSYGVEPGPREPVILRRQVIRARDREGQCVISCVSDGRRATRQWPKAGG